jgi:hypothetical protein
LLALLTNLLAARASEFRAAHRRVLSEELAPLGKAIHEAVASSSILHRKATSPEALENWRRRAAQAADQLKGLRLRVRYSLWGLDEALRVLSRLPHWITNFQDRPTEGEELLVAATALRDELDRTLQRTYSKGRPPTRRERNKVLRAALRVRKVWEETMPSRIKAGLDEADLLA